MSGWLLRSSFSRDLVLSIFLAVVCIGLGGISREWFENETEWVQWILSGLVSLAVAIPNLYLVHSRMPEDYPAAAPLLATFWRTGTYACLALWMNATKWTGLYFSLVCLQGCYFPFLLLESGLFIHRICQKTPANPSR